MKTKSLIIGLLIVAQIGAFTLKANAQYSNSLGNVITIKSDTIKEGRIKWSSYNSDVKGREVEILADETTLSYTDKYAKIECDNDSVFMKIFKTHYQIISRFTASWKNDRYGRYKRYTIYLNKEDAEIIKTWAKSNL